MKCKVHIKHFYYRLKNDVTLRERSEVAFIGAFHLWAELAIFIMAYAFYFKSLLTNKPQLLRLGCVEDFSQKWIKWGFLGGSVVKNLPADTRDTNLTPDMGRSYMPHGD